MDVFSVLTMLGGLALFMFGMMQMGAGLEKASSGGLARMLEKMTSNRFKGVLLGAGVTAIIQSSSATTVTVVGFVNSGIMKLNQAISVIMGANIGTTITAWILSLSGIQGDSVWIRLLKPSSFTPVLAVIGCVFLMFSKSSRRKDIGGVLLGFAVLMFGMETMSAAVKPLADVPGFRQVFTMFENPILGVLAGAVLTGIIQSSSVSVGILQALSLTGSITFASAIPIIMGQNIGTCVTALLSCVGANKNARRAAMVHLYFNLIGTAVFLVAFYVARYGMSIALLDQTINAAGIAIAHSVFNLISTALLLPFTNQLEQLARFTIRDQARPDEDVLLDERLLATPTFALKQCRELTERMAGEADQMIRSAIEITRSYDETKAHEIEEAETRVDKYEDRLGTFLVRVSAKSLSAEESKEVSKILHSIGDFERIADHAINLTESAQEIHQKKIEFTQAAQTELKVLTDAVSEILDTTMRAFRENNVEIAKRVEPLEEVIDGLVREIKSRHIDRLCVGLCTVEYGFVFADLLANYERVADHCSNLAISVIELSQDRYNAHAYQRAAEAQGEYAEMYQQSQKKYVLP